MFSITHKEQVSKNTHVVGKVTHINICKHKNENPYKFIYT